MHYDSNSKRFYFNETSFSTISPVLYYMHPIPILWRKRKLFTRIRGRKTLKKLESGFFWCKTSGAYVIDLRGRERDFPPNMIFDYYCPRDKICRIGY